MKSPKDDFAFERPNPDEAAIRKNLPYHRKLAGHIRKAAQQLAAVNPDHASPNILAFVTHAPEIERRDLHATIAGLAAGDGRQLFMLSREDQERTLAAARNIGLFLWINADKGTCQHVSVNNAPHQQQALDLLGLSNSEEETAKTETTMPNGG
jgi:hypothetical protein